MHRIITRELWHERDTDQQEKPRDAIALYLDVSAEKVFVSIVVAPEEPLGRATRRVLKLHC